MPKMSADVTMLKYGSGHAMLYELLYVRPLYPDNAQ